jgi:hypothetical protein
MIKSFLLVYLESIVGIINLGKPSFFPAHWPFKKEVGLYATIFFQDLLGFKNLVGLEKRIFAAIPFARKQK